MTLIEPWIPAYAPRSARAEGITIRGYGPKPVSVSPPRRRGSSDSHFRSSEAAQPPLRVERSALRQQPHGHEEAVRLSLTVLSGSRRNAVRKDETPQPGHGVSDARPKKVGGAQRSPQPCIQLHPASHCHLRVRGVPCQPLSAARSRGRSEKRTDASRLRRITNPPTRIIA
jgi:hypothetical protein